MGLNLDEQKAVEKFKTEVVEPSMTNLVILDFYADWCGPCKAIAPMLEKVAADYADKGVVLKKIDVDAEQFIASQFQVQSIPTIYAMFQGQPVADLTQARSESQLKQVLDQLLEKLPIDGGSGNGAAPGQPSKEDIDRFVAMGEQVLADGDAERAAGIFSQVVDMAADNASAHAGLIRALVLAERLDEARAILEQAETNPAVATDPAIQQARTALEFADNKPDEGEFARLREEAEANPDDMDKGLAYAEAAFAAGKRDEAADKLLSMIQADREWNEGAAKAKLLQFFEAAGLEDPWTVENRRRLSRILFG